MVQRLLIEKHWFINDESRTGTPRLIVSELKVCRLINEPQFRWWTKRLSHKTVQFVNPVKHEIRQTKLFRVQAERIVQG